MSGDADHDRGRSSDDLNLTAFALGQLDGEEQAAIERQLADANGVCRQMVEQTQHLADEVRAALTEANPAASDSLRKTLLHRLADEKEETAPQTVEKQQSFWRRHVVDIVAGSLVLLLLVALLLPASQFARRSARQMHASNNLRQSDAQVRSFQQQHGDYDGSANFEMHRFQESGGDDGRESHRRFLAGLHTSEKSLEVVPNDQPPGYRNEEGSHRIAGSGSQPNFTGTNPAQGDGQAQPFYSFLQQSSSGGAMGSSGSPSADASGGGRRQGGQQTPSSHWAMSLDQAKANSYSGPAARGAMGVDYGDYQKLMKSRGGQGQGQAGPPNANYQTYQGLGGRRDGLPIDSDYGTGDGVDPRAYGATPGGGAMLGGMMPGAGPGTEQYAPIVENAFIPVQGIDALSTFSIDVDTASYANVRRFLTQGQLPPPNAVRIEELVNYFRYDYPQPKAGEPFSVNMETAECPWQQNHLLLRVGLKGREIHHKERPVSNLVFLLDVSGSMSDQNKLPLLKQVLSMMVRELREDDRVSIVTYAGEAGLRLPPTTGDQQERILQAIDSLQSGGSTNGSAGIELAYEQARSYFRPEGTNRVILATDGDLNVGITDDESLVRIIKEKAAGGTFLTVLGFGEGNLKDAKMERLADNGNGLYAYIDSVREGRKVLIEQMSGSLVTIAKDVKIQIEFNPAQVHSYRLIGYENRMLTAPEFADDRRDAGEIGAGHTVTALYELVPTGQPAASPGSGEAPRLRYQAEERGQGSGFRVQEGGGRKGESGELLTLSLRYKEPDGMASKLSEHPLASRGGKFNAATKDFQFAAAVASFGMHLRNSQYRGEGNLAAVAEIAAASIGEDKGGYRAEFVDLVRKAQSLGVK